MKRTPADKDFSNYIRARDNWTCQRCGSKFKDEDGNVIPGKSLQGLHCSHYHSRGINSVRLEPDNCVALCHGCHRHFDIRDQKAHTEFMIRRLGQDRYDTLLLQRHSYKKKDPFMDKLMVKALLKELE